MQAITETYNLQSPLKITIEWERSAVLPPLSLCISALLLNENTHKVESIDDFVFYGACLDQKEITTPNKSIKCDKLNFKKGFAKNGPYKMAVDLDKINQEIKMIQIFVSIVTKVADNVSFSKLSVARFAIKDNVSNYYLCELKQNDETSSRSVAVVLLQRWQNNWRLFEEKNYYEDSLEGVIHEFFSDQVLDSFSFPTIDTIESQQGRQGRITSLKDVIKSIVPGRSKRVRKGPRVKAVSTDTLGTESQLQSSQTPSVTNTTPGTTRKGPRVKAVSTDTLGNEPRLQSSQKPPVSNTTPGTTRKGSRVKAVSTDTLGTEPRLQSSQKPLVSNTTPKTTRIGPRVKAVSTDTLGTDPSLQTSQNPPVSNTIQESTRKGPRIIAKGTDTS